MNIDWDGKGSPPVGAEIEIRINYDKAPPYVLSNLAELGIDIRKKVPKFERAIVAYCSEKYLVTLNSDRYESLSPMTCVEIRPFVHPQRIAAEVRKKSIAEMVRTGNCHPSQASKLYDAGYRKFEIVGDDV